MDQLETTKWYTDWQSQEHASVFDSRSALDKVSLTAHFKSFNDVQLLDERLGSRDTTLLEVGCATGEFYRYLRSRHPRVNYYGLDVSEAAIARARAKYPLASWHLCDPAMP